MFCDSTIRLCLPASAEVCKKKYHMISMEAPTFSIFKTILGYSAFILAAPITTFFISKVIIFEGVFGATGVTSNVWSAVFAVVILHIALGLYIYKAYFEAEKGKTIEKVD